MSLITKARRTKTLYAFVRRAEENILKCKCRVEFVVRLARQDEYAEFKRLLDVGKHPTFIGREMFSKNANNGGALFYIFAGGIVAASLINPKNGVLLVLNVHPQHRGHGLGGTIINFLMPNFARVLETKVPWFEKNGYVSIGRLKSGLKLKTQIMIRKNLLTLAGNLKIFFG